jgi:hypothetical protein
VPAAQVVPQISTTITLNVYHYKHDDVWSDVDDSNKCNDVGNDDDNIYVTLSEEFANVVNYLAKFKGFY